MLLDRPPGREAYPGDIFYVHAELLERAAALSSDQGGGSVTAFPLVETTDGDISAYIPTNLISITDGQIYLDTGRFERDLRPAIDIGRSVSRIGAVAQPPPMRKAAKNLKIQLSRFESLEKLSRVGLDIDVATQATLQEGHILRALLRQKRFSPRSIAHQVLTLTAVSEHWLSELKPWQAVFAVEALVELARQQLPEIVAALDRGEMPPEGWKPTVEKLMACGTRSNSETGAVAAGGHTSERMKRQQYLQHRLQTLAALRDAVGAMRSLSAHHFRRARQALAAARQYRGEMDTVIAEIGIHQPLHVGVPAGLLVIASDLGLCGDYNSRLSQLAVAEANRHGVQTVYSVGTPGARRLGKKLAGSRLARTMRRPVWKVCHGSCWGSPKMCWRIIWRSESAACRWYRPASRASDISRRSRCACCRSSR